MSNNTIATRRRGATDRAAHKANMRLHHFLNARFWRGHGVHSPFVYHIVRHVISGRHNDQDIRKAAALYRHSLLADKTAIVVGSIGAIIRPPRQRTVSDIARQTSTSEKYGRLLARLACEMKPDAILELGTSVGVSTAYLALARPEAKIFTIEGLDAIAYVARQHLSEAGLSNVNVVCGDIDDNLRATISSLPDGKVEFAFIDANHSLEATTRYFEMIAAHHADTCLIIFDDIFWSDGMTDAWHNIIKDPRVMTTIELPRMGLAFFRPGCQKEHYVVRW